MVMMNHFHRISFWILLLFIKKNDSEYDLHLDDRDLLWLLIGIQYVLSQSRKTIFRVNLQNYAATFEVFQVNRP